MEQLAPTSHWFSYWKQCRVPVIAEQSATLRATRCSWNGYKLHIDTADGGIPVSTVLSSASMHDSLAAIPLSQLTDQRADLREYSRELNHTPLIDHNPRRGEKIESTPPKQFVIENTAEQTNARLKDEFGGRNIWVKGSDKVMSHLMFGLLVLIADQLMREYSPNIN